MNRGSAVMEKTPRLSKRCQTKRGVARIALSLTITLKLLKPWNITQLLAKIRQM